MISKDFLPVKEFNSLGKRNDPIPLEKRLLNPGYSGVLSNSTFPE